MTTAERAALSPIRQIAAHELVVDQMRRSLELGQFRPGDRLPTERELSEMLDVSRTVVRAAVAVLEREGRIAVRRGRGGGFTVVAPKYDAGEARRLMRENRTAVRDATRSPSRRHRGRAAPRTGRARRQRRPQDRGPRGRR